MSFGRLHSRGLLIEDRLQCTLDEARLPMAQRRGNLALFIYNRVDA
jgi:hypothetical protein